MFSRLAEKNLCSFANVSNYIERFAFICESYALIIKRHENELSGLSYAYI